MHALVSIVALSGVGLSMACTSATPTVGVEGRVAYGTRLRQPTTLLDLANDPTLVASAAEAVASYPSFNSDRLDEQLQIYAQYLVRFGPPDVLIVGSSRALQGIDPVALQQTLNAQGYRGIRVYNFSINGATARVVDLVVRRILAPDQLPRLLVWADGSRAINSGRADRTYSGIASSEGYKQLARGSRPIRVPPPVPPTVSSLCFNLLQENIEIINDPICQEEPPPSPTLLTATGNGETVLGLPPLAAHTVDTDLDAFGFQSVGDRFNPATYYRQFPRVSGRYDNSYVPFRLGGEQSVATARLANYARQQNIPLVFVNLPLSGSYLDSVRSAYEQQFHQHMTQLASRHQFFFRNLLRLWPTRNEYFADPSHINRDGARAVAEHLGRDRSIPWPRP